MSIADIERESIINEANTAQDTLVFLLNAIPTDSRELIFGESFRGDLDFSVLSTLGYQFIQRIEFTHKGEITSVSNLPPDLKTFICPNQMMTEFDHKLFYLEELDLASNHLRKIDLAPFPTLIKLNLNRNELSELKDIPTDLEELYIDHNNIRILKLKNTLKLRVLHCVGNDLIRIQNVPDSMVDMRLDESPMARVDNRVEPEEANQVERNIDYVESLHEYFNLKSKYEAEVLKMRTKLYSRGLTRKQKINLAKEVRPKCIRCSRPFGTVFESVDRKYIARCGNKQNPCDLNIQLYRGHFTMREEMMNNTRFIVSDTKESIIKQKLDTLFGYISEEESAQIFKDELETHNIYNEAYTSTRNEYNELHNNPHTRELILAKTRQLYELKNTMKKMLADYEAESNPNIMEAITNVYVNEYMPEIQNLRRMKYEVMEVNAIFKSTDTKEDSAIYQLFQKDVALTKLECSEDEPPRVIAFK
jgi:Leucine-rich repeat (LRR) protein